MLKVKPNWEDLERIRELLTYWDSRASTPGKEKEWLLMKKRDEFAEDDFEMKTTLTPALLKKLKTKVPPCAAS